MNTRSVQLQRNNVTPAQFNAEIRWLLRRNGLHGWCDYITRDLLTTTGMNIRSGITDFHPFDEVVKELPGDVQYYCNPSPEQRAEYERSGIVGPYGYNFIYEFTPDFGDEKKGNGYFYCSEF